MARKTRDVEIEKRIATVFRRLGYAVEEEVRLDSGLRPDLLVKSSTGEAYVIELKFGSKENLLPFAAIAQANAYKRALQKTPGITQVDAVVSSNVIVTPSVRQVSEDLEIVLAPVGRNGQEFLVNFKDALAKQGREIPMKLKNARPEDFRDISWELN